MNDALLDRIVIVLVGTLQSGNIGSVARAMKNMGLSQLRLVHPQCAIDRQAAMMATHGADILDQTTLYHTLHEAIADAGFVFGTSARDRRRRTDITPGSMAHHAIMCAEANIVAFIFGPEDCGLTNDELELCNEVITIPTAPGAASLNIAHAVLIVCYELYKAAAEETTEASNALASAGSLHGMYEHMRRALLDIGFLNPESPDVVMGYFKRIVSRAGVSEQEVRTMRGIFRQLQWYINHGRVKNITRYEKGSKK